MAKKRGAKTKYETLVKPYLATINEKVKQGVIEADIAKALGISVATLNNYKQQYPEFKEALSKDKGAEVLQELVNAGIKAATGYYVENEQTEYGTDKDGNPVIVKVVKSKVWQAPNTALNKFYVQNYGKEQGFSNDPLDYELKKAKAEFDKKLAEANNWEFNLDK